MATSGKRREDQDERPKGTGGSDEVTATAAQAVACLESDPERAKQLFGKLVLLTIGWVHETALGFTGNDADEAEDLECEGYARAWRVLHRFDPSKGCFEGWLRTIIFNKARDRFRSLKRRRSHLGGDPADADTAPAPESDLGLMMDLQERARQLPSKLGAIYEMRVTFGMTVREIAAEANRSTRWVDKQLASIRRHFDDLRTDR